MENNLVVKNDQQIAKLDNFRTVEDMLGLAKTLIDSKLVPPTLRTPEMVVTVIQQGRELGFGAVTSINNIHNIQGKPCLSVHAINAKLAQKGIKIKTLKDFEIQKEGESVDAVTTIRFYVPLEKPINNSFYLEEDVTFKWSQAVDMGLTSKDNWKKMKSIMLWNRCLSIGARRVAADSLLGLYEITELADSLNVPYNITEEGTVTILKD